MSRFLWKGTSLASHGNKVAWARVTLPRSEGGLGLKKISEWNKANITYRLWQVVNFNSNSVWALWVRKTLLAKHYFWTTPIPSNASWIWRKVLQQRAAAVHFIRYKVGNGLNINLWFDPWLSRTPLAKSPLDSIISHSGLAAAAKVNAIISSRNLWDPPISNFVDLLNMKASLLSCPPPSGLPDAVLWTNLPHQQVKVSIIWDSIRQNQPTVSWHKLVWHSLQVPRLSFFLWLAMHNRLKPWYPSLCLLCRQTNEDSQHLFFQCGYSRQVLNAVFNHLGWFGMPGDWNLLIELIHNAANDKITCGIARLSLAATVYNIWNERNRRFHDDQNRTASMIAVDCINLIKCKLSSNSKFHKYVGKYPHLSVWQL